MIYHRVVAEVSFIGEDEEAFAEFHRARADVFDGTEEAPMCTWKPTKKRGWTVAVPDTDQLQPRLAMDWQQILLPLLRESLRTTTLSDKDGGAVLMGVQQSNNAMLTLKRYGKKSWPFTHVIHLYAGEKALHGYSSIIRDIAESVERLGWKTRKVYRTPKIIWYMREVD